jgi:hypothetical protein
MTLRFPSRHVTGLTRESLTHESPMSSCWSCLVIIEKGAKVCPFCNADQTRPVVHVAVEPPDLARGVGTPALRRAVIAVVLASSILAAVCIYVFGGGPSSASLAEDAAIKSLVDVRADLSTYALSSGDVYPQTLEFLGDDVRESIETAKAAGYEISYAPTMSADRMVRAYKLLARAHKSNLYNFYIDQSGVIRATTQDRPANQDDPSM